MDGHAAVHTAESSAAVLPPPPVVEASTSRCDDSPVRTPLPRQCRDSSCLLEPQRSDLSLPLGNTIAFSPHPPTSRTRPVGALRLARSQELTSQTLQAPDHMSDGSLSETQSRSHIPPHSQSPPFSFPITDDEAAPSGGPKTPPQNLQPSHSRRLFTRNPRHPLHGGSPRVVATVSPADCGASDGFPDVPSPRPPMPHAVHSLDTTVSHIVPLRGSLTPAPPGRLRIESCHGELLPGQPRSLSEQPPSRVRRSHSHVVEVGPRDGDCLSPAVRPSHSKLSDLRRLPKRTLITPGRDSEDGEASTSPVPESESHSDFLLPHPPSGSFSLRIPSRRESAVPDDGIAAALLSDIGGTGDSPPLSDSAPTQHRTPFEASLPLPEVVPALSPLDPQPMAASQDRMPPSLDASWYEAGTSLRTPTLMGPETCDDADVSQSGPHPSIALDALETSSFGDPTDASTADLDSMAHSHSGAALSSGSFVFSFPAPSEADSALAEAERRHFLRQLRKKSTGTTSNHSSRKHHHRRSKRK